MSSRRLLDFYLNVQSAADALCKYDKGFAFRSPSVPLVPQKSSCWVFFKGGSLFKQKQKNTQFFFASLLELCFLEESIPGATERRAKWAGRGERGIYPACLHPPGSTRGSGTGKGSGTQNGNVCASSKPRLTLCRCKPPSCCPTEEWLLPRHQTDCLCSPPRASSGVGAARAGSAPAAPRLQPAGGGGEDFKPSASIYPLLFLFPPPLHI